MNRNARLLNSLLNRRACLESMALHYPHKQHAFQAVLSVNLIEFLRKLERRGCTRDLEDRTGSYYVTVDLKTRKSPVRIECKLVNPILNELARIASILKLLLARGHSN